jgi:hypothetical protein
MKMKKKLISGLLAGAFGALLLAPATYAWEGPHVERNARIWQDRQAQRRHLAEDGYAPRNGYYNGGYYYPRSYAWTPAPVYAYGYRHHHRHWHHGDDD